MSPDLSVIVPVYSRAEVVQQSIEALLHQDAGRARYEVVVVDDGSTDASRGIIEGFSARNPGVFRCISHGENRGLSAARNTGWRAAQSPIVAFLDCDLVASPGLVRAHLDAHAAHPQENRGVLGHVAYPPGAERGPLRDFGNQVVKMWTGAEKLAGKLLDWHYFLGGHISLKRSMLEKSGGFEEEHFRGSEGFEDWELGLRLQSDYAFRIVYAPEAVCYHHHWRSPREVLENARTYGRTLARWLEARPDLRDRVLGQTPHIRFLCERAPLLSRLREGCRRALINSFTVPLMLAAARWLAPRWEWGAAALYWKTQRHFTLAGFREGRKAAKR